MHRREGSVVRVVVFISIALCFMYGVYTYHDVQTRLKKSDEKSERLRQQHDSVSAQLQVVYEHKARLEKALQQEKSDCKKMRDELLKEKAAAEEKCEKQKQELLTQFNTLQQQHKMLKVQFEDMEMNLGKVQENLKKKEDDHQKIVDQHGVEFLQLKQQKENEIAKLKDQNADCSRQVTKLQNQLGNLASNYQKSQYQLSIYQQTITQLNAKVFKQQNDLAPDDVKKLDDNSLLANATSVSNLTTPSNDTGRRTDVNLSQNSSTLCPGNASDCNVTTPDLAFNSSSGGQGFTSNDTLKSLENVTEDERFGQQLQDQQASLQRLQQQQAQPVNNAGLQQQGVPQQQQVQQPAGNQQLKFDANLAQQQQQVQQPAPGGGQQHMDQVPVAPLQPQGAGQPQIQPQLPAVNDQIAQVARPGGNEGNQPPQQVAQPNPQGVQQQQQGQDVQAQVHAPAKLVEHGGLIPGDNEQNLNQYKGEDFHNADNNNKVDENMQIHRPLVAGNDDKKVIAKVDGENYQNEEHRGQVQAPNVPVHVQPHENQVKVPIKDEERDLNMEKAYPNEEDDDGDDEKNDDDKDDTKDDYIH